MAGRQNSETSGSWERGVPLQSAHRLRGQQQRGCEHSSSYHEQQHVRVDVEALWQFPAAKREKKVRRASLNECRSGAAAALAHHHAVESRQC